MWAEQALHMLARSQRGPCVGEMRPDKPDPLSDFSGGKKGKKPLEAKAREEAMAAAADDSDEEEEPDDDDE